MKLALVMTNDWELFGDGSGDFFEIQYDPTMKLFDLLEKHNAKITLMAECMQQWEHLKISNNNKKAKDIANAWENAIRTSLRTGNDVQLHLHPQWTNAKYIDGHWQLDMKKWSLASLTIKDISQLIGQGKKYLESILKNDTNEYRCVAFRAGSYCIQPSKKVLPALISNGFKCDTSVTKGLYAHGLYDFREAYSSLFPWYIEDHVNNKADNKTDMIEYPIYSVNKMYSEAVSKYFPKFNNKLAFGVDVPKDELDWIKKRDCIKELRYPQQNRYYKKKEKHDFKWYINKFFSDTTIQLDYDYLPATVFVKILLNLFNSSELEKFRGMDIVIPVIASGHIKDIHNLNNIENIIVRINQDHKDKIEFMTLTEAINNINIIQKEM